MPLESIWSDVKFSVEIDNEFSPMIKWYEKPGAGWLIRLGGLALIGISTFATMAVYCHVHMVPPHETSPVEFLLALIAFLTA